MTWLCKWSVAMMVAEVMVRAFQDRWPFAGSLSPSSHVPKWDTSRPACTSSKTEKKSRGTFLKANGQVTPYRSQLTNKWIFLFSEYPAYTGRSRIEVTGGGGGGGTRPNQLGPSPKKFGKLSVVRRENKPQISSLSTTKHSLATSRKIGIWASVGL